MHIESPICWALGGTAAVLIARAAVSGLILILAASLAVSAEQEGGGRGADSNAGEDLRGLPDELVLAGRLVLEAWNHEVDLGENAEDLRNMRKERAASLAKLRRAVGIIEIWLDANPDDPLRPQAAALVLSVYKKGFQFGMPGKEIDRGEAEWKRRTADEFGDQIYDTDYLAKTADEYVARVRQIRRFLDTGDPRMVPRVQPIPRHFKIVDGKVVYRKRLSRLKSEAEWRERIEWNLDKNMPGFMRGIKAKMIRAYGDDIEVMRKFVEQLPAEADFCRLARFVIAEQYLGRLEGFAE